MKKILSILMCGAMLISLNSVAFANTKNEGHIHSHCLNNCNRSSLLRKAECPATDNGRHEYWVSKTTDKDGLIVEYYTCQACGYMYMLYR